MKCPYCKAVIDDDSWYCDQCGKALMFCPECHQPKRGTECPACGADLVDAKTYHAPKASTTPSQAASTPPQGASTTPQAASTPPKADIPAQATPTLLEGAGFRLSLKEGIFGRTTGIYPELSTQIYVSGRHGELRCEKGQWQIRDLGSHNGTLVNGRKLIPNAWTDINVGDILKIATIILTVK